MIVDDATVVQPMESLNDVNFRQVADFCRFQVHKRTGLSMHYLAKPAAAPVRRSDALRAHRIRDGNGGKQVTSL